VGLGAARHPPPCCPAQLEGLAFGYATEAEDYASAGELFCVVYYTLFSWWGVFLAGMLNVNVTISDLWTGCGGLSPRLGGPGGFCCGQERQ
jgi:hypothetical protein